MLENLASAESVKPILFVSGNPHVINLAEEMAERGEIPDIRLLSTQNLLFGEEILEAVVAHNADVVIARGRTATYLAEHLPISVVSLLSSGFELLNALKQARSYGRRVAILGNIEGLVPIQLQTSREMLAEMFDMDLRMYVERDGDLPAIYELACQEGADVVVGGFRFSRISQLSNPRVPVVGVKIGENDLRLVIREARRMVSAIRLQKRQQSLFRAFIEHSYEGMIAVNEAGLVSIFNPAAEKILQVPEARAVGRPLIEICPGFSLKNVMEAALVERGKTVTHNSVTMLCNKASVQVNNVVVGGLVTFQDISEIHKIEAAVKLRAPESGLRAQGKFSDIFGKSPTIRRTISIAKEFAITDSTLLLLGESGTGKELFAQSIHNYSRRNQGPFVAINCAAIPADLLESELFGYEPGAFTGAKSKTKPGLFELAQGGTLFLDEIGEMDPRLQGKLLRVLQERNFMRLGSDRLLPVDVRLITATNQNLKQAINRGTFRHDLYYRLNVLNLRLPPLRACEGDVAVLARHFLQSQTRGRKPLHFTTRAIKTLESYAWPGNVRELANFVERLAVRYGMQEAIDEQEVAAELFEADQEVERAGGLAALPQEDALTDELAEIYRALAATRGNYTRAAELLGVSRMTLWRKLRGKVAKAGPR